MQKKLLRCLVPVFLAVGIVSGAQAATAICDIYNGSNVESQNYDRWASTQKSYTAACADGTLMRVQYVDKLSDNQPGVLVEYYDSAYNIQTSKTKKLPMELPLFGGFHETADNYFLVTGQTNPSESADVEVYRITKYDKSWNRISSVGLYDCNTTVPFDAGTVRMDDNGTYLVIHTSHEMYTTSDGLNHQANVTIQVDMNAMAITDSYTDIMNNSYGYVSHSFNQFIKIDGNRIVTVDHGDAYPRAIALIKYKTDFTTGTFTPGYATPCEVINVLEFAGRVGENATGAAVGGFEISSTSYLIAGHSVIQDEDFASRKTRNVFVASVDRNTSEVEIHWLTDFPEGDGTTSTPQLVKMGDDRFMVMWSRNNTVYYREISADGTPLGTVYEHAGNLSDNVPVVSDGKLVWYTWNNEKVTFQDIDLEDPAKAATTTIENGHQYENLGVEDGIAHLHCIVCDEYKDIAVAKELIVWWKSDGGNKYSSLLPSGLSMGDTLNVWTQWTPEEADSNMEILIDNPDVIQYVETSHNDSLNKGNLGYFNLLRPGTATITIRPKYNPSVYKTYRVPVSGPLMLDHFTAEAKSSTVFGDVISLEAEAAGGSGSYQYQFSVVDEEGKETKLKDFDAVGSAQWKPSSVGSYTLCVTVKDTEGREVADRIENFVIQKAPTPDIEAVSRDYCYALDAENESVDIGALLPGDCGTIVYGEPAVEDSDILEAVDLTEGILSYTVRKSSEEDIGRTVAVTLTAETENYETISVTVSIRIQDKAEVQPAEGSSVGFESGNAIIYGQPLSDLRLTGAEFVDAEGRAVEGTLSWEEPELLLNASSAAQSAAWIFTPDSAAYKTYGGTLDVMVSKAELTITAPQPDAGAGLSYDPSRTLKDIPLAGGSAEASISGAAAVVTGQWQWVSPDLIPAVDVTAYSVKFVPADSNNFAEAQAEISLNITKTRPSISENPSAAAITYGDALAASGLTGGIAVAGNQNAEVAGSFAWAEPSTMPVVSDSQKTLYTLTFTPVDSGNYECAETKITLTVNPAKAPDTPAAAMNVGYLTDVVSKISLPEDWSWVQADADKELIVDQAVTATAVYKDTENYSDSVIAVSITRSSCEHTDTDWVVNQPATCTENGSKSQICNICNATIQTEVIPATGHSWDAGTVEVYADAGTEGKITYLCANNCKDSPRTEDIPAVEIQPPSASAISYGSALGASQLTGGSAASGSSSLIGTFVWADASIAPEVSGANQYAVVFCPDDTKHFAERIDCGLVSVSVNPVPAPNPPAADMAVEYSVTEVSKISLPEGWSWREEDAAIALVVGEPATAAAVYRDTNNYTNHTVEVKITRSACGHTDTEWITSVPATCTEPGSKYLKCGICGEILEDDVEIAALGHSWGEWKITKNPSVTENGEKIRACLRNCGATETETIQRLTPPAPVPPSTPTPPSTPSTPVTPTAPAAPVSPAAGTKLTGSGAGGTYKVTAAGASGTAAVEYTAPANKNLTTVTIPATITINNVTYKVTSVAANAFKNSKKLKKIVIGSNVTSIGSNAFAGCKKLSSVTVGANVTTISTKAFYNCTALKKVTIPANVSKISKQAFAGCKKLKTITIKTTKLTTKNVGAKAFKGIYSKATIKVPKKSLKAYTKLLKKKGVGSKVKIKK